MTPPGGDKQLARKCAVMIEKWVEHIEDDDNTGTTFDDFVDSMREVNDVLEVSYDMAVYRDPPSYNE